MVGFQQSAQTLGTDDFALMSFMLRRDDPAEPLVNPLMMIVLQVLGQDISRLLLGGEAQTVETFLFDGSDESFCVGVQIRTARW